jgi:hypothetical protein
LWVRAPPNPNLLFGFESPLSRYGSHSAGGVTQSDQQFHTVDCCYLLLFFRATLADLTFLTPDWDAFKCYWYRFGRFQNTGNRPSRFENRQNAIGSNSFVPFLSRDTLSKPNVVSRFRQNLALLQPRLDIFLDYLDKLGIRRYPILVVAHTSHEEHWTVTNENLILVGPTNKG